MSATQGDLGDDTRTGRHEPPAGLLAWWRRRSATRRAHLEARHLLKEARRILKRARQQIPGAVAATVRAAIQAVDDAIAAGDVERMRKANATLDEVMDDHLSFARKSTLREYAESIGVAIAVALLLRAFVVEAFQIPSGSMIPTLEVGDHIFVSKFSYGLSIPFTDMKILQYGAARARRRDRVQVPARHEHRLHQARRRPARRHRRGPRNGQLYVNGKRGPPRARAPALPLQRGVDAAASADDHDCEHWIETLGSKVHDTILEPRTRRTITRGR